jgi:hypothetical protein
MGTKTFRFTKALLSILVAFLMTFTLIACDDSNQFKIDEALEAVSIVFESGDSATSVTRNLNLPTAIGDVTIVWSSSNPSVISSDGVVNRQFNDVNVVLTATATLGEVSATRTFALTVIAHDVEAALEAIVLAGANVSYDETTTRYTVVGDVTLPATVNGIPITWESAAPAVFSNDGVVVRPEYGQPDAVFVLAASINNVEREFNMLVPAFTEPAAALVLDNAQNVLLIADTSDGVAQNLVLPSTVNAVIDGILYEVTVTWESSEPTIISSTGVVVRPDENANVTMTATLTYQSVQVTKDFELVVLASADFVLVDNIAQAIEISRDELAVVRNYVRINGVTVLGITGDGVVLADESGIIFVYMGSRLGTVEVGQTYDVRGMTDRYFGAWQLSNNFASQGLPVVFTESEAEPFFPTPVEVGSVTDMLANHHVPSPTDPDIDYVYYQLTARVRIQSLADNYGTVFVNSDYDGPDIPTAANSAHTTDGVVVYYQSNRAAFNAFDDLVITFNVLLYGYRSDRLIFNVLFLETVDDIQLDLDDQGIVDVVEATLVDSTPTEFIEDGEVDLPTSLLGTTISWTSSHPELVNPETGAVTMPATGQTEVTLTATVVMGAVEKEVVFTVLVGELEIISIADALALASGTKVRVVAIVTGISANRTFTIQDETAAIAIFVGSSDVAAWTSRIGTEVEIIGTRGAFNGLEQINPLEVVVGEEKPLPIFADIDGLPLTAEALAPFMSQHVIRTGLVVTAKNIDTWGNVTLTMVDPVTEETIQARWDSRIAVANENISTVEVDDIINFIGAPLGWFNGPRFAYWSPTQIVVGEYVAPTDEARAEAVANQIVLPSEVEAATTLTLPATGAFDATIIWASNDNAVINAETGEVVLPAEGNVTVTLTATVTVGEAEFEKHFEIVVGLIVRTVSYVRDAEVGTVVTFEALVTYNFVHSSGSVNTYLQDETAGIYAYSIPAAFAELIVPGNIVRITASRSVFRTGVQVSNTTNVELVSTDNPVVPVAVEIDQLADYQGQLVTISGYLQTPFGATTQNFVLVGETGQTQIRFNTVDDNVALETALVGSLITVTGGVDSFDGNLRIMKFSQTLIEVGEVGAPEVLGAIAIPHVVLPEDDAAVVADVTLPTTGILGLVVEWSSDNVDAMTNEGVVTRPEAGQNDAVVTMTYEFKIGEVVVGTGTVLFTVLAEEPGEATETLLYSFDFETGHGFSYQLPEAEVSFTNLVDESSSMVTLYRVSANTTTIAEQTTSRALVISPRLGGDNIGVAYASFNFGGDVINKLEFETYFWNSSAEQYFTKYELHVWDAVTEEWVVVKDLLAEIAGTLVVNHVVLEGLEGQVFRFYAEGGRDGGNDARILLDNLKAYSVEEETVVEETVLYATGFEESTAKTSYASGSITANEFEWILTEALRGNIADDKKNDLWSIRGRQVSQTEAGSATLLHDFVNATKVQFSYANYGSLTDGRMSLWISNDEGTTWTQLWVQAETQAVLTQVLVVIEYDALDGFEMGDSVRFQFRFAGTTTTQNNSRLNLDDVSIFGLE